MGNVVQLNSTESKLRRLHTCFFERARVMEKAAELAKDDKSPERAAVHQRAADLWDRAARDVRALMTEK